MAYSAQYRVSVCDSFYSNSMKEAGWGREGHDGTHPLSLISENLPRDDPSSQRGENRPPKCSDQVPLPVHALEAGEGVETGLRLGLGKEGKEECSCYPVSKEAEGDSQSIPSLSTVGDKGTFVLKTSF